MSKSILALAYDAGIRPFDSVANESVSSRSIGDLAAKLLSGRNPYFDKEYRDRFGTKVHQIEILPQRLAMGAVESAQPPDGARRYRAVLFRADGEVMYQTPDTRILDMPAAQVDLRYHMQHVDEARLLFELCVRQLKTAVRMKEDAESVVHTLQKNSSTLQEQGP